MEKGMNLIVKGVGSRTKRAEAEVVGQILSNGGREISVEGEVVKTEEGEGGMVREFVKSVLKRDLLPCRETCSSPLLSY